jgi:4-amino-4-deoxy-L-arabinose transferase-like glycosyltransferase
MPARAAGPWRSAALLAALALSLVLSGVIHARAVRTAGPLNWDEGFHALHGLRAAAEIREGDLVRLAYDAYRSVYWPPLHALYASAFFLLFGATAEVARESSLDAYAATALLLALAGLRARGRAAALVAAAGFLLSPLAARLAGQSLTDVPALALFSLAFFLYVDGRRPVLLGLAVFATYLTRTNYGVLLALGLALAFAADGAFAGNVPEGDSRRAVRTAALRAFAALALPLLAWFAYPPKIVHTVAALANLPTGPAPFTAEGLLYYPRAAVGLAGTLPLLLVWGTALVLSLGRRALADRNVRLAVFLALLQIVFAEISHTKLDRHILPLAVLLPFLLGVLVDDLWARRESAVRGAVVAGGAVLLALQVPAFLAALAPPPGRGGDAALRAVAGEMARGGRTAFVASENALVPPPTFDFDLVASRAMPLDGAAALQTASELRLAGSGASLAGPIGRRILAEARRWPGSGSYSVYLGLPRGDEPLRWKASDFPPRLAALVARVSGRPDRRSRRCFRRRVLGDAGPARPGGRAAGLRPREPAHAFAGDGPSPLPEGGGGRRGVSRPLSWPQAASACSPFDQRTVTGTPPAATARANASTAASDGRFRPGSHSGDSFSGMRFTFDGSGLTSATSFAASSGRSLTPAMRTHSNVIFRPRSSGQRLRAAKSSASGCVRLIGMSLDRVSSSAPESDTARFGRRGRAASDSRPGTTPAVETVVRRGDTSSSRRSSARFTFPTFRRGSPIPMKTTFASCGPNPLSFAITRYWPTISPGVRFRPAPMRPVTQKAQSTAQPACDERQIVTRAASGVSGSVHEGFFFDSTMYTASIRAPSASSNRNFSVPSVAGVRATTFGRPIVKSRASASRMAFGRFDISANVDARRS